MTTTTKRPRGRPRKVDRMNIVTSDVEDVAETVKLHIMAWAGLWELHVDEDGNAYIDQPHRPHYPERRLDEWLVGTYTGKVPVAEIEDDLVARLREIKAGRAHA